MKQMLTGPPESRAKQRKIGITAYIPPPGAVKLPCDTCGSKCWIGPTQLETKKREGESEIICFTCAIPMIKSGDGLVANLGGVGGTYSMPGLGTFGPDPGQRN